MTLPMLLDARLVRLANDFTADIPLPPPRVMDVLGSPTEQVLRAMRATVRADEDAAEEVALANCEAAGRVRAAQLAAFYGMERS